MAFKVNINGNVQYANREAGIKAHAEEYSFNIDSELFQQLTPEQQKLWRKEIEQAVVSGGHCGLELAKDKRYDKEPVSEKECMYSKDNYTDEDRKVLCDGCKEECKFNKKEELVSKDFDKEIERWAETFKYNPAAMGYKETAQHFANWQKQQMMAKAVDAECFGFQNAALFSFRLPAKDYLVGSQVKVIVIKED